MAGDKWAKINITRSILKTNRKRFKEVKLKIVAQKQRIITDRYNLWNSKQFVNQYPDAGYTTNGVEG